MSAQRTIARIESRLCQFDDYRGRWLYHSISEGSCRWCERSTRSLAWSCGI